MGKYSVNKKLDKCLSRIERDLIRIAGTKVESLIEIRRYMAKFPKEPDYNIVQHGNMLIYTHRLREFYRECGYKSMENYSDVKVWDTYLRQVGYVARLLAKETNN